MPRQVKAWACAYKCGHRVSTRRESIEWHERTCLSNPERRACETCTHGDWIRPREGEDFEAYRDCALIPDGKRCAVNCADWESGQERKAKKEGGGE